MEVDLAVLKVEIDHRHRRRRHAERHATELALHLGQHQRDGLGGAGRRRDDVDGGAAATFPIFARRTIDGLLGGGVAVHRRHQTLGQAESFLQHDVHDGREAVGGAARVRNDAVLAGVVLLVVHAHDHRDVLALGRGRDDDLLRAGGQMSLGLLGVREEAGRLDDVVDAQLLPGELGRRLGADHQHVLTVDGQHVVGFLVRPRLLRADVPVELALDRVVLQQVGEVVGGDDVTDGDHLDLFAEQTLLVQGAKYQATNPTETVDGDTRAHCSLPSFRFS